MALKTLKQTKAGQGKKIRIRVVTQIAHGVGAPYRELANSAWTSRVATESEAEHLAATAIEAVRNASRSLVDSK